MLEDRQEAMVEVAAGRPPDCVLDAVAAAGELYEQLQAADIQLHFRLHPGRPGVLVELQDRAGSVLGAITPSQALSLTAVAASKNV